VALSVQADYLLTLDDDQTFAPQAFDILWEHRDKRIVSGLYFTRGIPPVPCIFNFSQGQGSIPVLEYPDNELFEVQIVGFGFLLVDVNVFRQIPGPHFQIGNWMGEDVAFGVKCQAAGIPLLVHTGCKIGHIMEQRRVITEAHYLKHKERAKADDRSKVGAMPWPGERRAKRGSGELGALTRSGVLEKIGGVFGRGSSATEEKEALPAGG
jgi:hypothetical protein